MEEQGKKGYSRRRILRMGAVAAGTVAGGSLLAACGAAATNTSVPAATTAAASATTAPAVATPAASGATTAATANTPAAAKTTAAVTNQTPLKIGLITAYSKVFAGLGDSMTKGFELYMESIGNVAGGRKIQIIKEDEENDGPIALRKVRKFVDDDKVDLVTGIISTAVAYAVRDFVVESKMPLVVANAGGVLLTRARKSQYIIRISFSAWQKSYPMGKWVYENKSKKVLAMASDFAFGQESIAAFDESYTAAGGKLMDKIFVPLGTSDYSSFLTQAKQANPEAIYAFFAGTDGVNFVKQFDQFGLKTSIQLLGTGDMVDEDTLPGLGKSAIGAVTANHYALTLDNPVNKKFVADYTAKYGKTPDSFSMQGYDAARVIVEGVNALQGNTSDKGKLADAFAAVKFDSPRGPFEIDPDTRNVIQNIYVRETKDVSGVVTNVPNGVIFPKVKDPGK